MKTAKEIKELTLFSRLNEDDISMINHIEKDIESEAISGNMRCLVEITYRRNLTIDVDGIRDYLELKGYDVERILSYYHTEHTNKLKLDISWGDA